MQHTPSKHPSHPFLTPDDPGSAYQFHQTGRTVSLSGLRLPQSSKVDDVESWSEWSSNPPTPVSLTSSLLELSPLSPFSYFDLDPTLDAGSASEWHAKPAVAELQPPTCIKVQQPWSCKRCGSPFFSSPPTTSELYLLSIPMPCSTRSKNPSTNAPVEAPAAKRGPGRKRKADEPASATAAANQGLSAAPSDTSKSVSKKKRTLAAQSSNTAQGTATFVDPPNQDLPRPPSPIPSNIPEPMAIDAEPQAGPVALPPTAQAPVSATEESMEPGSEDQGSSTPANAPGDNTRNRNQRAPGLREENAALSKANEELEAKLKQMTGDLRTLKKFKVLWIKEYAKKSQPNVPVPSTSLIPRPPGEKGKNGWNLQEALGLKDNEALYSEMLRYVRHCISRSGLDWESTYSEQEPARLAACFKELKKEHPYLERFQGDWPGKEMVISALQNRRKVLNAKAKAKIASDEKAQAELNAAAATLESGDM